MAGGAVWDVSQLLRLEKDLGKVAPSAVKAVQAAVTEGGEQLREEWAGNVRATGGSHLPWLPDAITAEPTLTGFGQLGVVVGPETGRKQGALGKGDEYGSVNTPAHMNGHRATDTVSPRLDAMLGAAMMLGMSEVTRG
jgi:hypothetical protein